MAPAAANGVPSPVRAATAASKYVAVRRCRSASPFRNRTVSSRADGETVGVLTVVSFAAVISGPMLTV